MRTVVQRVSEASVVVEGETVGSIGPGLLALVGIASEDGPAERAHLVDKLLHLRIFEDDDGKLNRSVRDVPDGGVLLVSNFTVMGETKKGRRPSFTNAMRQEDARPYFDALVKEMRDAHPLVETGRFGMQMAVRLVNDGPITVVIESR